MCIRDSTDLATMEGANEAARRAVNAILEGIGSQAPRCPVWPLQEPPIFGPARLLDRLRWMALRRNARPLLEEALVSEALQDVARRVCVDR